MAGGLTTKVLLFLHRIWKKKLQNIFTARKLWAIQYLSNVSYYYGDVAPKP